MNIQLIFNRWDIFNKWDKNERNHKPPLPPRLMVANLPKFVLKLNYLNSTSCSILAVLSYPVMRDDYFHKDSDPHEAGIITIFFIILIPFQKIKMHVLIVFRAGVLLNIHSFIHSVLIQEAGIGIYSVKNVYLP